MARTTGSDEANLTAVLHCRVPSEVKAQVLALAKQDGRKPAAWVRRQIELGIRKAAMGTGTSTKGSK